MQAPSPATGPKPTAAPMATSLGARRGADLLAGQGFTAIQEDEDEMAQVVIVCEPEGR